MSRHRNRYREAPELRYYSIYNFYYERLCNLALSQFEWFNLPDTVDRRYMEKTLLFEGTAAWYWPRGLSFPMVTSWIHLNGQFDSYGYPTDIVGVDFNGSQIPVDDFIIVYDTMSRVPIMQHIRLYANILTRTHLTADNNLMRQNTPYILSMPKKQKMAYESVMDDILSFNPVVSTHQNMKLEEAVLKVDLDVPYKVNDILDTRQRYWNDAISILGIASETTKKERMISGEIALNRQEDNVALNTRLLNRVELANKLNEHYGFDIEVNMSDVVIDDANRLPQVGEHDTRSARQNEQRDDNHG